MTRSSGVRPIDWPTRLTRQCAQGTSAAAIALHIGAAVVSVLVLAPAAWSQTPTIAGRVKLVSGAAFIIRASQTLTAKAGDTVFESDAVKTGPDGHLGITLKDDTRLSLDPNAELRLNRFTFAPAEGRFALVLQVVRGIVAYVSGRIARLAPDAIRLETPDAIIGIRGTHLVIRSEL